MSGILKKVYDGLQESNESSEELGSSKSCESEEMEESSNSEPSTSNGVTIVPINSVKKKKEKSKTVEERDSSKVNTTPLQKRKRDVVKSKQPKSKVNSTTIQEKILIRKEAPVLPEDQIKTYQINSSYRKAVNWANSGQYYVVQRT